MQGGTPKFSWPVLGVPLCLSITWLLCVCVSAVILGDHNPFRAHFFLLLPIHYFSFSPNRHFDVKPRRQTLIISSDSLRKSCPNCHTALLPSLLSKVCVSLDSSVVFSLVVWVLSSLLYHAASQLISVISAVSGHGKAPKALMCILISPPYPEEHPGTASLWVKTPLPNAAFLSCVLRTFYLKQGGVRS